MAERSVQRRLAAILAADNMGYSQLMEADEEAAIATWRVPRIGKFDSNVAEFNGRIVNHIGDGFPVEFSAEGVHPASTALDVRWTMTRESRKT